MGDGQKAAAARVTVVMVSYNSCEVIKDALASVDPAVRIIVVDNASSDGTVDFILRHYPSVDIISNVENIGFARANNLGLAKVETEFALLMNPDARFLSSDTVDRLLEALDRYEDAAIISPSIIDDKGDVQLTMPASVLSRRGADLMFKMEDVIGDVCTEALPGALMVLRMSAFVEQKYYFDPNIFMYFEDDDICMSARNRGYSVVLVPGIRVMHLVGRSSPPSLQIECLKTKHRTCAKLYILDKYGQVRLAIYRAIKLASINALLVLVYALTFKREKLMLSKSRVAGALLYLSRKHRVAVSPEV